MRAIKLILFPFVIFWDKIILLLCLWQRVDELKSFRNLHRFNTPQAPSLYSIWDTLFEQQPQIKNTEIDKIYKLNSSIFFDWSLQRVDYYITNHFWSLLDFFEIDTWNWSNEDVFGNPSLITYVIFKKDEMEIVIVSLQNQQYKLLKSYSLKRLPLWKFKRRQLVYEKNKGFLSI